MEQVPVLPQLAEQCTVIEPIKADDGAVDWDKTKVKVQQAFIGFPKTESGAEPWVESFNQLHAQETERELLARMQEFDRESALPGSRVGDWGGVLFTEGGSVVDAELAKQHPCTRINLGDGAYLVFAHPDAVNGALSDVQMAELCVAGYVDKEPTPAQLVRIKAMADGARACSLQVRDKPLGDQWAAYHSCLGDELRAKGIK